MQDDSDGRWEPDAVWECNGARFTLERTNYYFQGMAWVHFRGMSVVFEQGELIPVNGWRFVGKEGT